MRKAREPRQYGFTLVELLIVIAIIGLIISLILVAAADGVRRAEERATQALISKLDAALNDRIDALLNTQPPINQTHRYLAAITYPDPSGSGSLIPTGMSGTVSVVNSDDRRAAVIAQFDYLRSELPDVFFRNDLTTDGAASAALYPLNFAASPYPSKTSSALNFILPLGNNYPGLPLDSKGNLVPNAGSAYTPPSPIGVFGASFSAAGGIYKQLGYAKTGYDGVDNNGDGYIDDTTEGGIALADLLKNPTTGQAWKLGLHTHKTARAEMLYAVLVEGLGPLGSSFGPDDFTSREVKDTDGDGLMEFVDAWGEPLQFYRWPIYYGGTSTGASTGSTDSQVGCNKYGGFGDVRQQDPLDPNQLLVSPAWWTSTGNAGLTSPSQSSFSTPNGGATTASQSATAFMGYFHSLIDPYPFDTTAGMSWDRGGGFARRAYFSRFLVLSGGPDRELGVGRFDRDYSDQVTGGSGFPFPGGGLTMEQAAKRLILIENQAAQSDPSPSVRTGAFFEVPDNTTATSGYLQTNATLDDISNHNLQGISTGVR